MSDFKAKCTKIQNSAGAPPQTPLGSLQRSRDPLAGFKGAYFYGKGREWMGREGSIVESKKILKIDPAAHMFSSSKTRMRLDSSLMA